MTPTWTASTARGWPPATPTRPSAPTATARTTSPCPASRAAATRRCASCATPRSLRSTSRASTARRCSARATPTCRGASTATRCTAPKGRRTAATFHLFSPEICAKCHADKELMGRYGLSADVFDTYVSDFHGTTVELFQKTAPDQQTNKPVCIDCHGVHDMKSVDDPESTVIKANLLKTCQKCHPDATRQLSHLVGPALPAQRHESAAGLLCQPVLPDPYPRRPGGDAPIRRHRRLQAHLQAQEGGPPWKSRLDSGASRSRTGSSIGC